MKKYIESSDVKHKLRLETMNGIVFRFSIWFDSDMYGTQYRYVLANSEAEAIAKLETCNDYMVRHGLESFTYSDPVVELENVIY